ncbi:RNA methyltransferase [Candidatus Nomurabacteria bacterium]|nr:RNA methyltransferase [Candidatus Nomurabacteria bacterium]
MVTDQRLEKYKEVVSKRQKGLVVVLEDITDPHNAAAILRSCDAFGIQNVYFIFDQTESYDPKRVGRYASSYANKWLTYHVFYSTKECLEQLRADRFSLVGAVLDEQATDFFETDFTDAKLALLVGNEKLGLSKEALGMCDKRVYLPMQGFTESFNVSVAAALFMYEITRQRMESEEGFTLSKEKKQELLEKFLER